MAEERYKSISPSFEQVAIPRGPGTASAQESVRLYSGLPDAFSKVAAIGKQLYEEGVVESAREKAALLPDETIQEYKDADLPHIGQKAGYELAVKVSAANLEVEASKRIQETLLRAQQEKWETAQFDQEISAIHDGFVGPINDLDPATAANLQGKLTHHSNVAQLKFNDFTHRKNIEKTTANGETLAETIAGNVEVAARTFDNENDADEYLSLTLKDLEESLQALGNSPSFIQRSLAEVSKKFHIARIRGEFQTALEAGQGTEYLQTFNVDRETHSGSARGLDDNALMSLSSEMSRASDGQNDLISDALKDIRNVLTSGFTPENLDLITDAALNSDDPEIIAEANNILVLDGLRNTFGKFSANDIAEARKEFFNAFMQSGDGINKYEQDQLQLLDRLVEKALFKANENLVNHAIDLGVQIDPLEIETTIDENGITVLDMRKFVGDMQTRAAKMRQHAREHNATPSFFSDDERRRFGAYLDDADNDPASRASFLVSIFRAIEGDDALRAIQEINSNDSQSLSGVAQMASLHMKGGSLELEKYVGLAFRGSDLKNQNVPGFQSKEEVEDLDDIFSQMVTASGGQNAVDTASMGAALSAALNIYRGQVGEDARPFEEIVQTVFGAHSQIRQIPTASGLKNEVVEQGGLAEIDDVTLWLAPNMTAEETENWYHVRKSLNTHETGTDLFAKLWRRTYGLEDDHPFPGLFWDTEQEEPSELNDEFWKLTSLRQMEGMPGVFYLVGHDGHELYDKTASSVFPEGYGRVIIDLNQWPAILKEEGLRFDP